MRSFDCKKRLIAAFILCVMLTGCGNTTSSTVNIASTPSVTSEISRPVESEVTPQTESTPPTTSLTESTSESTLPPVTSVTESTADTSSESEPDTVTSEAPLDSQPPVTTAATSSEQTTTTPATTTTTPATTKKEEKPPAPVVIPDIEMPSSPATSVITADGNAGVIDYSNASDGYISVTYTGSAPKVKLRITCDGVVYNHNVPIDGATKYFPLSCGSGDYTIILYENAEANLYSTAAEQTITVNIANETSPFTYPNYYIEFSKSSACVKKAAELCAGVDDTVEKIAAIFGYVTDNVSYDKQLAATVQSGYVPYPDNTLSSKKGICFDYSSLFAAMTRSQGIPTRLCIGYASPDIYHAWNEVYTKETGWITPELFLKKKGYNLVDATFYSGANNKTQISEYISNNANYSVIYYY